MRSKRMNNIPILFYLFLILVIAQGCINLRTCNDDLEGKYYCEHQDNATNYLILNQDRTYLHFYKKGNIELSTKGVWSKSTDGSCTIRLKDWENYNESGVNYEDYVFGLLYINGDYLDISPDGNSSSSFKKE